MSKLPLFALVLGLGIALGATTSAPASAAALACDEDLCVDSGDATWTSDKTSTSKDRKKRSKKTAGTLSVTIDEGRGSVFLNGRYVGTAPVSGVEIPSGVNDLQVRDGADVLATGTLKVAKNADVSVSL